MAKKDEQPIEIERRTNPVVFISYSWDNENHKQWVLNLADKLCSDGVNVILDRYEMRLGRNLHQFVEQSITKAEKILLIFTPNYKIKAERRVDGVGYEYSIINANLYNSRGFNQKVIPILRAGTLVESIPSFMTQFIHLDVTTEENFQVGYIDLLRELHDEPAITKPTIGSKPLFNDIKKVGEVKLLSSINVNEVDEKNLFAELRKRVTNSSSVAINISFSEDAVSDIIEKSIKPLARQWENKLTYFDTMFYSRTSVVSNQTKTVSGVNLFTTLESIVGGDLPRFKKINEPIVKELKLHASLRKLRNSKFDTNFNGGEIVITFHQNLYEVQALGSDSPITHLYSDYLSEDEIDKIVDGLSVWFINNIEQAIQNESNNT